MSQIEVRDYSVKGWSSWKHVNMFPGSPVIALLNNCGWKFVHLESSSETTEYRLEKHCPTCNRSYD